jgi:hypothetical protein
MRPLPTRLQLSPTDGLDLDEAWAWQNFGGKSFEAAERMFLAEGNFHYLEDLVHMGIEGLRFYLPATAAYLRIERSADEGAWDLFVPGLVYVIESRLQFDGWQAAAAEMEAVLLAILPRHATYGLDEAQLHTLLRRLQQQGDSPGAARS